MKKSLLSAPDRKKLNELVERELYAHNMYKYFSTCMQKHGYFGAQTYFLHESEEELKHWKMVADFMNDMGDEAEMPAIKKIDLSNENLIDLFNMAYEVEYDLLELYSDACMETKSAAVKQFLLEMVEIQRKSVGEYGDLIARLEIIGSEKSGLLTFDNELK